MGYQIAILRYDGKYDFFPPDIARQWTILNHWIDESGADRFKGSFSLQGLRDLGILKSLDK